MRLILLVCFLGSVNHRVPTVLDISGNFKSVMIFFFFRPEKVMEICVVNFFFFYAQVNLKLKMNVISISLKKKIL